MQSFVERYYTVIFPIFLALALGGAFEVGRTLGRSNAAPAVTLSCDQSVLRPLAIPLGAQAEPPKGMPLKTGKYVGSKNGTKYYAPECPAARRIKAENMIWFTDVADARIQGYTPASHC